MTTIEELQQRLATARAQRIRARRLGARDLVTYLNHEIRGLSAQIADRLARGSR